MMFALVPRDNSEWTHMRMFSSFSAAEDAVMRGIMECRTSKKSADWFFLVAYDGIDELTATFVYVIGPGNRLIRKSIL